MVVRILDILLVLLPNQTSRVNTHHTRKSPELEAHINTS